MLYFLMLLFREHGDEGQLAFLSFLLVLYSRWYYCLESMAMKANWLFSHFYFSCIPGGVNILDWKTPCLGVNILSLCLFETPVQWKSSCKNPSVESLVAIIQWYSSVAINLWQLSVAINLWQLSVAINLLFLSS